MDLAALTSEVLKRCDILAGCSEEPHRLTRTFLRQPMHEAHRCLTEWMSDAGLQVRRDALGNLIGRRDAPSPEARVFVVGSHIDTVPNAGKYDGVLGVLLGVAAMKALKGRAFHRAVDIIAFSEEEGVRFATPFLGSRAVSGRFDRDLLDKTDDDGVTIAQALLDFQCDLNAIARAAYPTGQVAGYLETHIEQGPILESLHAPVGIVEAIAGQSRRWLHFLGSANHAGTQPMQSRRDALAGAAEFISFVERTALTNNGLRATVGSLTVEPNAVNVVPGSVRLSLDIRHASDAVRQGILAELLARSASIARERKLALDINMIIDQAAVPADLPMTERLAAAVKIVGQTDHRLVSGAGHDALIMADICPIAMLFVRSPGGISHHPDESVYDEDVKIALEVIIRFLDTELERTG